MNINDFAKLDKGQLAEFKKQLTRKSYSGDIEEIHKLAEACFDLNRQIEGLRAERNQVSKEKNIKAGEKIKVALSKLESKVQTKQQALNNLWDEVPNLPAKDIPDGGEENNKPVGQFGKIKDIKNPKDHIHLGQDLDIIDIERGVKTSGSRFYFLKNQAVELEFSLIHWVMDKLKKEGFELLVTPQLVQAKVMSAGGYLGQAADEVYKTQDNLYLIGTAEQTALGFHMDEIIEVPKRYAAFSTCFRREAGSYGQDVKGIIRTHQFDKVEMFSFVDPKDTEKEHDRLVKIEEQILKDLEIPYQKVLIAAGDLGMSAAKKIDLESWIPSQNRYRETHSCSNCTDWQARRAMIRFKNKEGKTEFVNTLNGTAIAVGRLLVAMVENHQQKDGSIKIPKALHRYLSFKDIK